MHILNMFEEREVDRNSVVKDYLTTITEIVTSRADKLDSLNRFVVVFLEAAELRAKNHQDITMEFWRENIDRIIEFNDKELLKGYGSISHEQMKKMVEAVYLTFDAKRKKQEAIEADMQDLEELQQLEVKVKKI